MRAAGGLQQKVHDEPQRPVLAFLGGAKGPDKLHPVLKRYTCLISKFDKMITEREQEKNFSMAPFAEGFILPQMQKSHKDRVFSDDTRTVREYVVRAKHNLDILMNIQEYCVSLTKRHIGHA